MKIKLVLVLSLVCALTVNAQNRVYPRQNAKPAPVSSVKPASNGQVLPIRRVILYSNGVAYIERRGVVSGRAEINLSFKQSQVDDVLKSMVVLDLGQGRIGAVSYNSSAPVGARMAEIPFSVEAQTDGSNGGLAGVLAQLQGARVAVVSTKGAATGSILTVEKREIKSDDGKSVVPARFLVVASETGEISSFDMADVRSLKLLDEGTRKDLNEFANATASTRRRDAKTITVTSEGAGQREMIVSYTIAAPIWKTTYRVVLDYEGKPFFQGWAIVDNVSEEDWSNVKLSLVSGTPISFIQQIQQPFYRYRPIVPLPNDLKLNPQTYEEGGEVSVTGSRTTSNSVTFNGVDATNFSGRGSVNAPRDNRGVAQQSMLSNELAINSTYDASATRTETSISTALSSQNSGVETAASGEEIGDLFEYRIDQPVTVPRDRSALIPIVQTKMEGERISIYNETTRRDRPMSGMLLKNLTPLTLESGSLTVIDRDAYAGEALMERLKPKEQRLISFALDLGTLVTSKNEGDREAAKLVKAANGVFEVHYFSNSKKVYNVQNQTDRERIVYIEHPIRQGWELSDESEKPAITTQRYYRFRVELKPFSKVEVPVIERQGLMDSYALRDLSYQQLELFIARRYINEETKRKLEKLIALRGQINQINAKIEGFEDEEEKIAEDQKRLRENIEALSKTPEAKTLITRYISKADEQETRLESIAKERQTLQTERQKLEGELANEIRAFTV